MNIIKTNPAKSLMGFQLLCKECQGFIQAIRRGALTNPDATKLFISQNILEKLKVSGLPDYSETYLKEKVTIKVCGLAVFRVIEPDQLEIV